MREGGSPWPSAALESTQRPSAALSGPIAKAPANTATISHQAFVRAFKLVIVAFADSVLARLAKTKPMSEAMTSSPSVPPRS